MYFYFDPYLATYSHPMIYQVMRHHKTNITPVSRIGNQVSGIQHQVPTSGTGSPLRSDIQNPASGLMYKKKLTASILPYAMFIMVIITVILGSVLLLSKFNHLERNRFEIEDKLRRNVESGINLMMADTGLLAYNEQRILSLYDEEFDSIFIRKKLWGLFDQLYCRSSWKNILQEKIVLADAYYKDEYTPAIYLADNNKPLCLSGNTYISGDCLLPRAGVKNGYVEGRHYERLTLIEGKVNYSETRLPLHLEKLEENTLDNVMNTYLKSEEVIVINYEEIEGDTLANSFFKPVMVVYASSNILLDKTLLGNIVLIGENEIIISNRSHLQDVLVYAKYIFIEQKFSGRLQCFATNTLITAPDCNFQYPSNLVLLQLKETNETGLLKLGKGSIIDGAILSYIPWSHKRYRPQLTVGHNTTINGQIYSNGTLELFGDVYGSVYCTEFILKRPSAIYINHLLDVEVNPAELSIDFVGVDLLCEKKASQIIQRLL